MIFAPFHTSCFFCLFSLKQNLLLKILRGNHELEQFIRRNIFPYNTWWVVQETDETQCCSRDEKTYFLSLLRFMYIKAKFKKKLFMNKIIQKLDLISLTICLSWSEWIKILYIEFRKKYHFSQFENLPKSSKCCFSNFYRILRIFFFKFHWENRKHEVLWQNFSRHIQQKSVNKFLIFFDKKLSKSNYFIKFLDFFFK